MLTATAMTGAAMKTFSSIDADGPAATLILRAPRGPQRLIAAKARMHARYVALVAGCIGALAVVVTAPSLGGSIALAGAATLTIVASAVGVVTGTALFPRLDWTSPEQIGAHPGAQGFELGIDIAAWTGISMLAAGAAAGLAGVDFPRVAGVVLVLAGCWAGALCAARVAVFFFDRLERS